MIGKRAIASGALPAVALLLSASGCGDAVSGGDRAASERYPAKVRTEPTEPAPRVRVRASHCPSGHPSCRTARGEIVYVERVDPDGDGDAHFVIRDPQGITLPGLTAIDVRKGLRPHPLPEVGETISAAGPVQIGSYGQEQIHALELHIAGE